MSVYTANLRIAIDRLPSKYLKNLAFHYERKTPILAGRDAHLWWRYGAG